MLTCTEVQDTLSARLDGELPSTEVRQLDAHITLCASCRELAEALENTDKSLRSLAPRATDAAASARLINRLRVELSEDFSRAGWGSSTAANGPSPVSPAVPNPEHLHETVRIHPAELPVPAPALARYMAPTLAVVAIIGGIWITNRPGPVRTPQPAVVSPAGMAETSRPGSPIRPLEASFVDQIGKIERETRYLEQDISVFKVQAADSARERQQYFLNRRIDQWK